MIATLVSFLVPIALAADIPVQQVTEDIAIEQMISDAASHAKADLRGAGSFMELNYTSTSDIDLLILFMHPDGSFISSQTLQMTLPAGSNTTATIDLRKSSAWNPNERTHRLHFFGKQGGVPMFHGVDFLPASFTETASALWQQLLAEHAYTPSIYHRIAPYRVLGMPITPLVGVLMIAVCFLFLLRKNLRLSLYIILAATLLVHARFSLDATRYTFDHVWTWMTKQAYASAGSLPQVASDLLKENAERVYLCNDGTTYAQKLLQYHAYPTVVTTKNPTHVVVHRSFDWSFTGNTLYCHEDVFQVNKVQAYSDGSSLYRIQP